MKFNFKIQPYQTEAVESVVEVFKGQTYSEDETSYCNGAVELSEEELLFNIREVQQKNNVRLSEELTDGPGSCSLDVEMETGTGKTYVYIKTMYELNRLYGWSKFIVVVPSVAIREGVRKTFEITEEHFMEQYGKKIRYFVYNSARLNELEHYSNDSGIHAMIINMQAFNTSMKEGGKSRESRLIYDKRDEFGSRRPIDVIQGNHPIIILDEPQKMGGAATRRALKNFNPLFCLNYSATHKEHHNLVYVLDAVDAYKQKLVKKIEVKGVWVKNLRGVDRYLYLDDVLAVPNQSPRARLELEIRYSKSINREMRSIGVNDDLYVMSKYMEQYRGYRVSEINPQTATVTFTNGEMLQKGDVAGDVSEKDMRRIQIRETIISHMEKEEALFDRGIKTLSLFFIDEVSKYRSYDENGAEQLGEYGKMFEEEYQNIVNEYLTLFDTPYQRYLKSIEVSDTHKGYFSVDKKGRTINSTQKRGADCSDDISAYDLILRSKERLLSFEEPTRFLFSHSALREGWDNPNVFQICTLKHSDSAMLKRQEVGRGLRLCVNQDGYRMDGQRLGKNLVHKINKLTVIASESYRDFAADLQKQIKEVLYDRPAGEQNHAGILEEMIENGNQTGIVRNALNENFRSREFRDLWDCINHKYVYRVAFDSEELIQKSVEQIDRELFVSKLQYTVSTAEQCDNENFGAVRSKTTFLKHLNEGQISYDLIGNVAEGTGLTRKTVAEILRRIRPVKFQMFQSNPEEFISKVIRLVNEQKALAAAEHIVYSPIEDFYEDSIFTEEKCVSFDRAYAARKHISDYVSIDSIAENSIERRFAEALEEAEEVCVYAKLPRAYVIPTPVGNYSPDWMIAFHQGSVKHTHLIAETKGTTEVRDLRPIEKVKMICAKRLFNEMMTKDVVYCNVDSYQGLLDVIDSIEKRKSEKEA